MGRANDPAWRSCARMNSPMIRRANGDLEGWLTASVEQMLGYVVLEHQLALFAFRVEHDQVRGRSDP